MSVPASDRPAFVPVDPNLLTDVSPSVKPIYGRTTLVDGCDRPTGIGFVEPE